MKNLILIGAGGHSVSCIDVIEATKEYKILGLLDRAEKVGQKVLSYSILGTDAEIPTWVGKEVYFLITIGQIKSAEPRIKIWHELKKSGALMATVIAPTSIVSPHATVSEGTIVMHRAVVNANAFVGIGCILNSCSLVEHGARVMDFCHISTGALVNGDAEVRGRSFVGSGAILEEGAIVPEEAIVPAGTFFRRKMGPS